MNYQETLNAIEFWKNTEFADCPVGYFTMPLEDYLLCLEILNGRMEIPKWINIILETK